LSFEVKIPFFEGPFDLLLFFIERDELDIYDIPIARITHDFLDYLHQLEEMNIEVASEFILVAATLMRIKAKMLLPRPVLDEEGNEIDPREDLVKHLLEYKKYKSVVPEFSALEESMLFKDKRGNLLKEIRKLSEINNVEAELQDIDLYKLLKAFERSVDRYLQEINKPVHTVLQFPYTIEEQKAYILNEVRMKKRLSFTELIEARPERLLVIYNFLAILEILQQRLARIYIGEGFNNFWIELDHESLPAEAGR
jgi:segregation and condensation protein A